MNLFKKISEKLKSYEDWVTEANYYLDEGMYDKAVECYLKALEKKNTNPIDWFNLAYALYQLGKYDSALEAINEALKISPSNIYFAYLKGLIHYKLGEILSAYKYLKKASEKIKNDELFEVLGDISIKYEKYEEALKYYLKSYKLSKTKNINALFKAGKIYLLFGDVDKAYETFNEVLKQNPNHECKKIVECMERVVDTINSYEDLNQGLMKIKNKDYISALKIFNKVLQIDKNSDISYYYKSVIAEIFEEYKRALEYIDKSISIFSRSLYYAKKGDILYKLGDEEGAIEAYNKAIKLNSQNPYAYFGLAILHYRKGELEKSSNFFDKVLETYLEELSEEDISTLNLYSLIGKAETTGISKYYYEAMKYVDNLINLENSSRWWYVKGYIYYKLGNYKDAYESFMNALRVNPKDIDTLKSIAIVLEKSGKIDEAIATYTKILKIVNSLQFTCEINNILEKLKNRKPTNLEIPSVLFDIPVMYYKPNITCFYASNLWKYMANNNPIGAYIYLSFIESYISLDEISQMINDIKSKLSLEMYRYCELLDDYKPNESVLMQIKELLQKLGCML